VDDPQRPRLRTVGLRFAVTVLKAEGPGRWPVDCAAAPHLNGCLDVDPESSATTTACLRTGWVCRSATEQLPQPQTSGRLTS
jgi:hypothetical protein